MILVKKLKFFLFFMLNKNEIAKNAPDALDRKEIFKD